MKSKFLFCSLAAITCALSTQAFASEYESVSGGPVQAFTQKNGDNAYTIFKFSLSGAITTSNSKVFPSGMATASECIGYSKTEKGISTVESYCTTTDTDGTISNAASIRVGAMGQSSTGKTLYEIKSGPNAGTKAECTFTPKYTKGNEGTYLIVTSKCTTTQ